MMYEDTEWQNGEVSRYFGMLVEIRLRSQKCVQTVSLVGNEDTAAMVALAVDQR